MNQFTKNIIQTQKDNPEHICLFRMGDFYEVFFEQAVLCSKVLGLTLTTRDPKGKNEMTMAGFPYHHLEAYIRKLIALKHKVAICEQPKS